MFKLNQRVLEIRLNDSNRISQPIDLKGLYGLSDTPLERLT